MISKLAKKVESHTWSDEDIKPPSTRSGRNMPNQYHIWAQTHIFHRIIQGIKEQAHQYIKLTRPTIQVNEQGVGPTCDISRRPIMKLMPHQQKAHQEAQRLRSGPHMPHQQKVHQEAQLLRSGPHKFKF